MTGVGVPSWRPVEGCRCCCLCCKCCKCCCRCCRATARVSELLDRAGAVAGRVRQPAAGPCGVDQRLQARRENIQRLLDVGVAQHDLHEGIAVDLVEQARLLPRPLGSRDSTASSAEDCVATALPDMRMLAGRSSGNSAVTTGKKFVARECESGPRASSDSGSACDWLRGRRHWPASPALPPPACSRDRCGLPAPGRPRSHRDSLLKASLRRAV